MTGKAVLELKYYSGKTYGDGGKAPRSSNVGIMEASGQLHAPAALLVQCKWFMFVM
jgi:hypothetical protein